MVQCVFSNFLEEKKNLHLILLQSSVVFLACFEPSFHGVFLFTYRL